jgi:hypothetical protein
LLAYSHNILNRWKNYFCHLLNAYGFNNVRQAETDKAEPIWPESGCFGVEIANENLKRCK